MTETIKPGSGGRRPGRHVTVNPSSVSIGSGLLRDLDAQTGGYVTHLRIDLDGRTVRLVPDPTGFKVAGRTSATRGKSIAPVIAIKAGKLGPCQRQAARVSGGAIEYDINL